MYELMDVAVKDVCKNVKCGHGNCILTSAAPFYEYKPNPFQNGGSCAKGRKRASFKCSCPHGYTGKFCEVGPNDCYQEDGEFYHGMVSETVEGKDCLDWNAYFIVQKGGDPFQEYAGFDGIGPHNYCRNPDGDDQPWCFINNNGKLIWSYCNLHPPSRPSMKQIRLHPNQRPPAQFSQREEVSSWGPSLAGVPADQICRFHRALQPHLWGGPPRGLLAMLQLKVSDKPYCAKETRFVKTACLPQHPFDNDTECVISRWGVTETQKYGTNLLLDARVLLISQEKCKAPHVYGNSLDDSMFCAGNMRGGGDSGGPLRDGTHYVVGVVSWGDGCRKKYKPVFFTALRVKHSTMLTAGALLICLCALSVHGQHHLTVHVDYGYDYTPDTINPFFDEGDWLYDLMEESSKRSWTIIHYQLYMCLHLTSKLNYSFFILPFPDSCDPNPCNNAGSCQMRNVCENVRCGRGGNCVMNVKNPPYYECKCRPPYHGTNCSSLPSSACEPNPCQNGGSCMKGNRRLRCFCPDGYTGKFCEIAPTDCYEGNGVTYRGVVSMADGRECLDWHSYFIVSNGEDPFTMYSDFTGLEQNNHCRNPDGDDKPWCFTKKDSKLQWEYCNVKKCSDGDTAPPTPLTPVPGSAQFSQCGKSPPVPSSRIYGGKKAVPGAHPWQVSVQTKPKGSNFEFGHHCGGSLSLPAGCSLLHTACGESNLDYQVVMGGVNIEKQEEMDQTIPVIQTIVHENYRATPQALYNDIALLKLQVTDSPYCAKETRFVKAVCLPDQAFPAGKECVISGWGATETQRISSQLLNARVFVISDEKCKNLDAYRNVLDSSMFCAGTLQGGIDSCQGDSGGPLVCEKNGTQYISGVVSWGKGCAVRKQPGVYASVHAVTNWIKNNMK
ncbi:hypothetical protein F7725_014322 [Dissostichus mawsoni]|uniref:trypsin n=1 Tax=Dissostichus mawsoni TaxID=36200 RepID=A0A7J5YVK2_DISMA|nr:hypothetical protein F7725_014322 [Dissostichus mawsoni]